MFGPRARARPAPGLRYGCDLHKRHKSRGRGQGAVFEAAKSTEQPCYKHRKREGPGPGFLFALHSPWSSSKMFSGFRSLGRKRLDQQEAHHESEAHKEQRRLSKSRVNSRGMQCPCLRPPLPWSWPCCSPLPGRGRSWQPRILQKEAASLWLPPLHAQNSQWGKLCKREGAEAASACPAQGKAQGGTRRDFLAPGAVLNAAAHSW